MKKAQGLALNTMAVAAIVLIVIVITIAIFSGVVGNKVVPFFEERSECEKQTNSEGCVAAGECKGGSEIYGLGCEEKEDAPGPYCCIKS
ncbi:hypothetical protein J4470_01090 [Candidatus Woesearchaeota archaeon]|nr:hypothetical protein [Candidatus Woesearchaeota archaeon]